jgi:tRNA (guanine37-N1)-methyltransferase
MLEVHLLTLFPEAVEAYLDASILKRVRQAGLLRVHVLDFRRFAVGKHRHVDDRPYGGGPGMVLRPEPIFDAVEWVETTYGPCRRLLLTPSGNPFRQAHAAEMAARAEENPDGSRLLLLCGRYEGFDERIRTGMEWTEYSLGDFVLCGGELPALAVIEATARLLPGALGHEESAVHESFTDPLLLDHPHYTRPEVYRDMAVPPVLLSGHHGQVAEWRREQAEARTAARRPDLHRNQTTDPDQPQT